MPGGNGSHFFPQGQVSEQARPPQQTESSVISTTQITVLHPTTDHSNPTAYVQVSIFGHVKTLSLAVQG